MTVTRGVDRKTLTIAQKKFLLKSNNHNDTTRWEIKLNYATSLQKSFQATQSTLSMSRNQATLNHTLPNEVDWVIFNIQQTGKHFRHIYSNTAKLFNPIYVFKLKIEILTSQMDSYNISNT